MPGPVSTTESRIQRCSGGFAGQRRRRAFAELDDDAAERRAERLRRVGDEVHQHLLQLAAIAEDRRHLAGAPLEMDGGAQHVERLLHHLRERLERAPDRQWRACR
jgi:hypothetical protein